MGSNEGVGSVYSTQKTVQKNFFSRKAVGSSMTLRLQFISKRLTVVGRDEAEEGCVGGAPVRVPCVVAVTVEAAVLGHRTHRLAAPYHSAKQPSLNSTVCKERKQSTVLSKQIQLRINVSGGQTNPSHTKAYFIYYSNYILTLF